MQINLIKFGEINVYLVSLKYQWLQMNFGKKQYLYQHLSHLKSILYDKWRRMRRKEIGICTGQDTVGLDLDVYFISFRHFLVLKKGGKGGREQSLYSQLTIIFLNIVLFLKQPLNVFKNLFTYKHSQLPKVAWFLFCNRKNYLYSIVYIKFKGVSFSFL